MINDNRKILNAKIAEMRRLILPKINPRPLARGFTLVEMTIVVVIMGIFMTLGLAAFTAQMNSAAAIATRKKQEIIQESLIAYLRDYKRLPCPETTAIGGSQPTGLESRQVAGDPASLCSSFWGTVPFATLGLSKDIALDGYDNFYTYFVSAALVGEPDWTLTRTNVVPGFSVGNPGRIAVIENGVAPIQFTQLAAAVLVSHGKNGEGAYSSKGTRTIMPTNADELLNAPAAAGAPSAWAAPPVLATVINLAKRDASDTFDDVFVVMRPNDLINPLIKDGSLKSAVAVTADQLLVARDAAISQMLVGATCIPIATQLISAMPKDAWGTVINYLRPLSGSVPLTLTTPAASTVAFQVWSSGADRQNNSGLGDDEKLPIGIDVTYGQIRSRISAASCP